MLLPRKVAVYAVLLVGTNLVYFFGCRFHWIHSATAYNHSYGDAGVFCVHASADPSSVCFLFLCYFLCTHCLKFVDCCNCFKLHLLFLFFFYLTDQFFLSYSRFGLDPMRDLLVVVGPGLFQACCSFCHPADIMKTLKGLWNDN